MESSEIKTITLPDGRKLAYAVYGVHSAQAPTILYFHGFPGSHQEGNLVSAAAQHNGVRIIAPSRPGSSASTFQSGRKLTDYPADILALVDQLSIHRFAMLGVSGGAPYCLACWNALPHDRLAGLGLVAGLMPLSFGTAGMLIKTRVAFWIAPWATWLLSWAMDSQLGVAARDDEHPEKLEILMDQEFTGSAHPAPDIAAWNSGSEVRPTLIRSVRDAFKGDVSAYFAAWEARIYAGKWGFELGDLHFEPGKVVLWHGKSDVNVPFSMSEKAAALMPGAELRALEGETHLSICAKGDEFVLTLKKLLGS